MDIKVAQITKFEVENLVPRNGVHMEEWSGPSDIQAISNPGKIVETSNLKCRFTKHLLVKPINFVLLDVKVAQISKFKFENFYFQEMDSI